MAEGLRITGGTRRGRKLLSPPKNSIRPASDLIRQAVFNMLGASIEDAIFYDVFAGTGVVGLEALSRGARSAVFVERDRHNIALIRRNLDLAKFSAEGSARLSDAFVWAKHFIADKGPVIAFLGPPYPLFDTRGADLLQMVADVLAQLDADDILVLQFPKFVNTTELPDQEGWVRLRRYGKSQIGIWRHADSVADPTGDDDQPDPSDEAEGNGDDD